MAEIKSLKTLAKASATANDVLLVTNTSTNIATKYNLTNVFPSLLNHGTAEQLFVDITGKNQLRFKSLKSADTKVTVRTVSNDLVVSLVEAQIDLNNCNNTSSEFTKGVDFNKTVLGINAVSNGGTGIATILKGAFLYATDINVVGQAILSSHGTLLIGNGSTGLPVVSTITAGDNVTVTNGPGSITIAASLTALAANLDCATFGVNLNHASGRSWLSGDGTAEGVSVDTAGKVFIGDSVPTLPTIAGQLHIAGASTTAIAIGNTNDYKNHSISALAAPAGVTGLALSIEGANATSGNSVGGILNLKGGSGYGSGSGGGVSIYGGNSAFGLAGAIKLYTTLNGVNTLGLKLDYNKDVTIDAGNAIITSADKGLIHTGSGTVTQATNLSTAVTLNTTSGVITLAAVTLAAGAEAKFVFANSTLAADSVMMLTMQDENTTTGARLTVSCQTVTDGTCFIAVHNPAATGTTSATASKIHFLIINKTI